MTLPDAGRRQRIIMPPSSTTSATTGSLPAPTGAAIHTALSNFDTLPDGAYVRVPVVRAMYGVSTSTAWRMARDGRIPAATKISVGVTAWRVGDIRADLARRAAA